MKRIVLPGLVAAIVMIGVAVIVGWLFSAIFPALEKDYANTALFRPSTDPVMYVFLLQPFWLGIGLAWVWQKIRGVVPGALPTQKGIAFASGFWAVSSVPGILMSYSMSPFGLLMVLTWLISSLLQLIAAGMVISAMNKER